MSDDVRTEVKDWLAENWDPDLSVGDWWALLGPSGWGFPTWPAESFGKGLSRAEARVVSDELEAAGALPAPGGLGSMLAGPTIIAHGNDEQKQRYLSDIVTGRMAWCQLFSEPEAGSDLAGLRTSALRDGDEWIVNGQKVWTSGGQHAELGMLVCRTDASVPKHRGISYFVIEMDQPGIEVRPLREMTGKALFNEVFITDARVPDDALIGGLGNGWAVTNTTLAAERASLGAGGSGGTSVAFPGSKVGHLPQRAGDFVRAKRTSGTGGAMSGKGYQTCLRLATDFDRRADANVRQDLVRLYTLEELARMGNVVHKALRDSGRQPHLATPNLSKLAQSTIVRLTREVGLGIMGPAGTLWGASAPDGGTMAELAVFSPGPSIYGGTDQVQRNIIGERGLGLPSEPRVDKDVPFKDLPRSGTKG